MSGSTPGSPSVCWVSFLLCGVSLIFGVSFGLFGFWRAESAAYFLLTPIRLLFKGGCLGAYLIGFETERAIEYCDEVTIVASLWAGEVRNE